MTITIGRDLPRLIAMLLMLAAGAEPALAQQDGRSFYEQALRHFSSGRLDEAVIEARNALQREPDFLPAQLLLSRISLKQGQPQVAIVALQDAAELGADDALIWPLRAQALLMLRQFDEVLRSVPARGFDDELQAQLLVYRGHALLEMGRVQDAIKEYARAEEIAPVAWMPVAAQANAALLVGDLSAAQATAVRATRLAPEVAATWNVKGDVLRVNGDVDGALGAYEAALERDPEHVEARLSRASLLVALERLDEAGEELERLEEPMRFDPRFSYARAVLFARSGAALESQRWLARAREQIDELDEEVVRASSQLLMLAAAANFEDGNLERARSYLQTHVDQFPDRRAARMMLARVLMRQGNAGSAVQVLEPAAKGAARDAAFLALLGEAHGARGNYQESIRLLAQAAALAPEDRAIRMRFAFAQVNAGHSERGLATLSAMFHEESRPSSELGVRLARLWLQRGEHAAAREVTQRLLELDPDDPGHLTLHAGALAGLGDSDAARALLEQALQQEPGHLPAALNLARLLTAVGLPGQARAVLERQLELHPADSAVMVALARVASHNGDDRQALRWLQEALSTDPGSTEAALALVKLHLQAGRLEDARAVAEKALARAPADADLLAAAGLVHQALGRNSAAVDFYRQMVRVVGLRASDQYRVARLLAGAGAYDDALKSLALGLRADPGHFPSLQLNVEVLARAGRLERALQEVRALREARPRSVDVRRLEARVLARLGRHAEALQALEAVHRLAPSTSSVLDLARLFGESGQDPAAREVLRDWLEVHPEDRRVEVALAERLLAAGDYAAARTHLEHVIRTHGENASVLNNLAFALDRLGDDGALAMARRAQARAPRNPAIADTLGWILVRQGEPAQGLPFLRDAVSRDSGNPELRYHLAAALAALGRHDEAVSELRVALRSRDGFAEAEAASELLRRLAP